MRTMLEGQSGTGYPEGKSLEHSTKDNGFISRMIMVMATVKQIFSSKPPASSIFSNVSSHTLVGHGNNLGGSINQ